MVIFVEEGGFNLHVRENFLTSIHKRGQRHEGPRWATLKDSSALARQLPGTSHQRRSPSISPLPLLVELPRPSSRLESFRCPPSQIRYSSWQFRDSPSQFRDSPSRWRAFFSYVPRIVARAYRSHVPSPSFCSRMLPTRWQRRGVSLSPLVRLFLTTTWHVKQQK